MKRKFSAIHHHACNTPKRIFYRAAGNYFTVDALDLIGLLLDSSYLN